MKTHTSSQFHWQITCPADWKEQGLSSEDLFTDYHGPANTVGFVAPDDHGSLFVSVIKTPKLNFIGFSRAMLGVMMPRNLSVKVTSIEVNGMWAYNAVYGEGSKGGRTRAVAFYQGGKRYTITFAGFDIKPGMYAKLTPTLDAIVHSFHILKP